MITMQFIRTYKLAQDGSGQQTHIEGPFSDDTTLCGLDAAGDIEVHRKPPLFLQGKHRITCPDCKAEGTEWHRMEFSSHAVLKKGRHAKYEIFNAVPEPIVIEVKGGCASVEENPTDNPVRIDDLD